MRTLILALLVSVSVVSAQAETTQGDPLTSPNAEMSAESEALMRMQEVQTLLEAAGYKDVQVAPDVLVIRALDATNNPVVMIVDPQTLANLPIEAEPSTTGSGSSGVPH